MGYEITMGILAIILTSGYAYIRYFGAGKYNIRVIIKEERQGIRRIKFDRGRKIKKEGKDKTEYHILLRKDKNNPIPIPEGTSILVDGKGKDVMEFYSPADNQYYPTQLVTHEIENEVLMDDNGNAILDDEGNRQKVSKIVAIVRPIPTDMMLLLSLKTRQAFQRFAKKSDWEKVAPIIFVAVTGIVMTIFIWTAVTKLIEMEQVATSASGSLLAASEAFKEASRNFLAAKGITPPPA